MAYYAGIDASLETVNVCIVDEEGGLFSEIRRPGGQKRPGGCEGRTSPHRWLRRQSDLLTAPQS